MDFPFQKWSVNAETSIFPHSGISILQPAIIAQFMSVINDDTCNHRGASCSFVVLQAIYPMRSQRYCMHHIDSRLYDDYDNRVVVSVSAKCASGSDINSPLESQQPLPVIPMCIDRELLEMALEFMHF